MTEVKKYWFRPKRFWGVFAAYYPTSIGGWLVTLVAVLAFLLSFFAVDASSHSASDTLIGFAPWAITIALIVDLICFRTGEYPSWWRRRHPFKKKGE